MGKIGLIVAAFVPLAVSTAAIARIADAQSHVPDVRFVATPPEVLGWTADERVDVDGRWVSLWTVPAKK